MMKYFERMFDATAAESNKLISYKGPVGAIVGLIGGYFFSKKMPLNAHSAKKVILAFVVVTTVCEWSYLFIGCEDKPIVGYTIEPDYVETENIEDCNCKIGKYDPVCAEESNDYYLTS